MRRPTLVLIAALCVLTASSVLVGQSPPLTPFRGLIDHISADQWGGASAGAEVWHRAISGDGRFVVINSPSSDLSAGDNEDYNGYDDVFLRDRMTGAITRISRSFDGGSGDGLSQMGTISTNGRHVAFASGSSNLVSGDTNGYWDVFVRDLDQQRTVRVSVATDGTQGDRDAYYPSLSADGRFVAFVSWATTFAPGVSSSAPRQMYLHDRDADGNGVFDETGGVTTELVSAGLTGEVADQSVDNPRVSSDGRYLLFETSATNLESSGNLNGSNHLYRRDRQAGQTELIDQAMTGGPSAWGVGYGTSDMSDDGRFITFSSISQDIVWFDMNWQSQVFLYDTVAGPSATTIVSQLPDGTIGDGSSYASSVSADGRYVLFTTAASNLAWPPPGASGPAMLAVRDMLDGSFARVDVLDSGEAFDQSDYYYTAAISADGTAIVLQSRSNYALGGGYSYGASHAFVLTAFSASPASASYPAIGGSGSIEVNTTAVSGWSVWSPFPWIVVTEGDGFGAGARTVQYDVTSNDGVVRDGWILVGSKYFTIHQDSSDTTPPIVTPTVTGTLGDNGWYTSDVSVYFLYEDPDSPITSAVGCDPATQTTDTAGTTFTCTVTSEGGSASGSITVKRDATPPGGIIWGPPYAEFLHQKHRLYVTDYDCGDSISGIASCMGPVPDGGYLPTNVAGRFTFDVLARDRAGNTAVISRPYYVSTNVCSPRPPGLVGWWPGDGHSREIIARNDGSIVNGTPIYTSGPYGMGFVFIASRYMWVPDVPALRMDDAFTLSAWVYQVRDWLGPYAVIAGREGEYLLARGPNGNIHYSIANTNPGWGWVDSGVRMDREKWTKLALSYDGSAIRLYKNGQLVHERAASGVIGDAAPFQNAFQVAARQSATEPSYFDGEIDDVELVDRAMSDAEIDTAYFSGLGGICSLTTTLSFTPTPQRAAYGGSAELVARLIDDQAQPLANEQVQFTFRNVSVGTALTDATGVARMPVSIDGLNAQTLANAAQATHPATVYLKYSTASSDFVIDRAAPVVTWSAPSDIVYGQALGMGVQLNATADVAGTFVYSPAAGATLPAGAQTLGVTFTPSSANYTVATASVPLTVLKAAPTVTAIGGTFTYDKQPHAGSGAAVGVFGEALTPVTVTYDGSSSTPPTTAGNHTVSASYAGSANYLAGQSADAALTINRATPTVEISSAPVWYTGQPRPATVVVHGVGSDELNPFTVLYNGSASAPVNAGTYALEVQYAGSTNYSPTTVTGAFVVNKATPIIGTLNDITGTYDGQPWGVNVNIAGVAGEWLTPVIQTYNGSTDLPVDAGVYAAVVRYDGSVNYEAITRTYTVTILKAVPYLQWGPVAGITYGMPLGASQLNPTSDVPGSFAYSPGAGAVLNAGSHTLSATFTPADTVNYEIGSISRPLTVSKANAQAVWYRPDNIAYGTPLGPAQLNATAPTPGTFTYSPAAGTVLGAGDHVLSVTFVPNDAANWNGSSALVPFTVVMASPIVSWNNPPDIVYGTALSTAQLNASANVPGTFSYSPAAGAVLNAGSQTLSVTFIPDDVVNYNGASTNVSLTVTKAASTISWSNPADIVYGAALGAAQLNATANLPGTFSYSPAAGTVLGAGTQTLSVTHTPADTANYSTTTASVTLNVAKAASTVAWANPADIVHGTALGAAQLNATANVAGTFSYSPAAGTALGAGSHTLLVTFTPDDAANYNGASASVPLTVTKADSVVSWNNPADIVYGTALGVSQLNAAANVAGTFSYSPATGAVLNAGSQTLSVTFTPDDAANYNGGSANVSLTVNKADSVVSWNNPADIVYGTALGVSQLNATANVAGTFEYSPAGGTVLTAGTHQLSVTFTPSDSINYTSATAYVSIVVTPATPVVSWSNPAAITYGTALSATQLNASATVAGSFAYSPAAGTVLNAGTQQLSVTFTPSDSINYTSATASAAISIAPAALTVQTNDATKVYGAALPAFTASGAGFVNGDSMSSLAGPLTFATSATATSAPGSYSVTPSGVSSANYSIAFANGTLTVTRAATSMTFTTTPNPSNHNQTVQLRAVVSAVAPGAGTATGTVEFRENGTLLATATLVNGVATMTKNFKRGTHPLTATYAGSTSFTGSSGSVTHQTQ